MAWLIVLGVSALLSGPVTELGELYNASVTVESLSAVESAMLLLLACGLGWVGAALSLRQHLKQSI